MAVELNRAPIINYKSITRPNLRLVSNNKLQINGSKAAFNASMERALLNQKYWEELLEKLRRAGGGGGGDDKRFDRIAVSMMLSNFLSNKTIQAMLRNFGVAMFNKVDIAPKHIQLINQNVLVTNLQKIGNIIFTGITNMISLVVPRINQLSTIIGMLSFQLNKLKEILEEDLKELIKKLDVKEKMRKIKTALADFFVEMKDEILNVTPGCMNQKQKLNFHPDKHFYG